MASENKKALIKTRVQELKELIANAKFDKFTIRIMDLSSEFYSGKELENRVILLRARYNKLKKEEGLLKTNEKSEIELYKINRSALSLLDDFEKHFSQKTSVPSPEPNPEKELSSERKISEQEGNLDPSKQELLIEAKDLQLNYQDFNLNIENFHLNSGEIIGVVGKNGSGKTTLLNILAGFIEPEEGSYSFPSLNCQEDWYCIKQQIGYFEQNIKPWYLSLKDTLHFVASIHGADGDSTEKIVDRLLMRLRLEDFKDFEWKALSGGFKRRFELARLLIRKPKILLLDEPLANLDINSKEIFLQDISDFSNSYANPIGVIISSQDIFEVERIADKILLLEDGKVIFFDKKEKYNLNRVSNTFELMGTFEMDKLSNSLLELDKNIEISNRGNIVQIISPVKYSSSHLLSHLLNNKVEISFFRDISKSTMNHFLSNDKT